MSPDRQFTVFSASLAPGSKITVNVLASVATSLNNSNQKITAVLNSATNNPNPGNNTANALFLVAGVQAFTVNLAEPIDFESVQVGQRLSKTLVIMPGSQAVDLSLTLTPDNSVSASVFTLAQGVNPNFTLNRAPQTIPLVFQPDTSGPESGSLDIIAKDQGQTITRTLKGQGTMLSIVPVTRTLAHVADGNAFTTTVILTSPDTTAAAAYSLVIHDESGNLLSLPLASGSGLLSGSIPPGGAVTIRTAGLGTQTVQGWAELTAPVQVGASVVYGQKNPNLPSLQEGTTLAASQGSQHFFLPFDNTNSAMTSMALTNPGTAAANITVVFRYDGGGSDTVAYPQLAARTHQAYALTGRFQNTAGKRGVAEFTSDADLFAVAFRFNSTGAFTAFNTVDAGPAAAPPQVRQELAHVADGNAFTTTVILTNPDTTAAAAYSLVIHDESGNLLSLPLASGSGLLSGSIPPGGAVTIRTAGLGTQTVQGWAELTAPVQVGASVVCRLPERAASRWLFCSSLAV